ncbi:MULTISPECIES: AbrB family transcriptional regulator [Kamptonema]|uniref:AbrB family transcriptional regulator n=1 Tax=Kamptonema TaxID=1501433 RepID=UPI0001DAC16A|nr:MULTISPECIES: AbrB family transcriptional regulator [Kamptonema]CBN57250.1 putative ammonia monooxygenase superfamily [Kamptonema sp. PCC 6506]
MPDILGESQSQSEGDRNISVTWPPTLVFNWHKIQKIVEQLCVAVVMGFLFDWFDVPVAWLLGPLVVGIAYASTQHGPKPFPSIFITVGKAIIGISSAARFSPETVALGKTYALPLLGCILITASLSMVNGYLLSRWTRIDRTTSFLGCIPGIASTVVALSEELGADSVSVAVLQYIRMILVVLLVPSVANFFSPVIAGSETLTLLPVAANSHPVPMFVNLLVLAGCCSLGIFAGDRLKLPTSGFLGSFLLGLVVFWGLPYEFQIPRSLFIGALLLVGLSIGLKFNWQNVRLIGKAVLLEILLVIVLMVCCLAIGYEFHIITHVDIVTAILCFMPGGMEAMMATVTQLGGDTGLVLAAQITRQMLIIVAINLLNLFLNPAKRAVT